MATIIGWGQLLNFFDSFFKKDNDLEMKFSLEIGPNTDLETVPPVNDVYITMLPGGDYKETAQKALELVKKGLIQYLIFQLDLCKMKKN